MERLNPDHRFVVYAVTRKEIARRLNDAIERSPTGGGMKKFTPDDLRLTDDVCTEIAGSLNGVVFDCQELVNMEVAVFEAALEQFAG